jgi:hypothetical protein
VLSLNETQSIHCCHAQVFNTSSEKGDPLGTIKKLYRWKLEHEEQIRREKEEKKMIPFGGRKKF